MRRTLLLLLLPLLLCGCPRRIDFGTYGRLEDPAFILRMVQARYQAVTGLVGEGKLSVDSPDASGTLRMAVEVAEPASIYLETADLLGTPRGTFATDGETFAFYRPDQDVFYTGPATAEIMGRFLPVALPPDQLASAMLGEIPILDEPEAMELELDDVAGTYVIKLRKGAVQQRVTVGTKDLRLISVETRGAPAVDAFLEDHEELAKGMPFPTTVILKARRARTEVKLRYTDIKLNPASKPESFRLKSPPSAKVEQL